MLLLFFSLLMILAGMFCFAFFTRPILPLLYWTLLLLLLRMLLLLLVLLLMPLIVLVLLMLSVM